MCPPPQRPVAAVPSVGHGNEKNSKRYHNSDKTSNDERNGPEAAPELEDKLAQFVNHFLRHPYIVWSLVWMQAWLYQQRQRCVLARLTHIQDCKEYAGHDKAAKFSFVFYLCLVSGGDGDRLTGSRGVREQATALS